MISVPAVLGLSYLLGSFPTSLLVGRVFFGRDIRKEGSGNAGATNTFRVLGWKAGLPVALIDMGKGAAAVLWVSRIGLGGPLSPDALGLLAGTAAVIGHVWSVFAGFKGGKGVATAAGALAALAPLPFAAALVAFVLGLFSTGIVSVGSLAAAAIFPLAALGLHLAGYPVSEVIAISSFPIAALIFWTHRKNIARLRKGEENRFERLRILPKLFGKS